MSEESVDDSRPVECYRFIIAGHTDLLLTSAQGGVVAESVAYTYQAGLKRGNLKVLPNGQTNDFQVTCPIDCELAIRLGLFGTPKHIEVEFKRYQRDDLNALVIGVFGKCDGATLGGEVCNMKFPDAFAAALGTNVPKNKTQGPCNWMYGDENCRADVGALTRPVVGIVQFGPGDYVIELSAPPAPPMEWGFFAGGKLTLTQGADTERLTIFEVIPINTQPNHAQVKLQTSFTLPLAGGEVTFAPGCSNSMARCVVYDNLVNFGGFKYLPTERMSPFTNNMAKGRK